MLYGYLAVKEVVVVMIDLTRAHFSFLNWTHVQPN